MKSTHNFSLITIFLLIFTRAVALVKIRSKMVICEKLFVNFIQNGVIIDTNPTPPSLRSKIADPNLSSPFIVVDGLDLFFKLSRGTIARWTQTANFR